MGVFSKHFADFDVAGTRFWDASLVVHDLEAGDSVRLIAEPDNPHDSNAVALVWHDTKLGYVPRALNEIPAQLLRFGHTNVLECRILKVDPKADTWEQIHVGLYFIDLSHEEA